MITNIATWNGDDISLIKALESLFRFETMRREGSQSGVIKTDGGQEPAVFKGRYRVRVTIKTSSGLACSAATASPFGAT